MSEPSELLSRIRAYPALLDYVAPSTVSGVGVILNNMPSKIQMQIRRSFDKRGKVFFFRDEPAEDVSKYADYCLILVTDVDGEYVEKVIGFGVGVLYVEGLVAKNVKKSFRAWKVYTGSLCRGKICVNVNWVARIPTYSKDLMFLMDGGDLQSRTRRRVEYKFLRFVTSYFAKVDSYVLRISVPMKAYLF